VTATQSLSKAQKSAHHWKRQLTDKHIDTALVIIWACTSKEFLYQVELETSGSACFAKLKAKFETTTFTHCVELHKAFYGTEHDPSKPTEI
jgi:hypothetical protein